MWPGSSGCPGQQPLLGREAVCLHRVQLVLMGATDPRAR